MTQKLMARESMDLEPSSFRAFYRRPIQLTSRYVGVIAGAMLLMVSET